jgi:antitoxin component YwqK of YwqJK toxin-antitoxin module
MHGFGRLYYPNGKIAYEGGWKNNEFYGKGKVYNYEPVALNSPFNFTDFN